MSSETSNKTNFHGWFEMTFRSVFQGEIRRFSIAKRNEHNRALVDSIDRFCVSIAFVWLPCFGTTKFSRFSWFFFFFFCVVFQVGLSTKTVVFISCFRNYLPMTAVIRVKPSFYIHVLVRHNKRNAPRIFLRLADFPLASLPFVHLRSSFVRLPAFCFRITI